MNVPTDQYADVVIVGAGLAGLSALVAANKYLTGNEHALIADIRPSFGGQWHDTYGYVRLHQPYQFFTAYDKTWVVKRDSLYLPSGGEVLEHLNQIGQSEMKNYGTKTLFNHRYTAHEVRGGEVHVMFESVTTPNNKVVVRTKKLIDAFPLAHPHIEPLSISSTKVKSITPNMLSETIANFKENNRNHERKCHFIIVGSGKTGMDAVKFVDESIPTAQSLIAGNGMALLCRDIFFPRNIVKRMFGGKTLFDLFVFAVEEWDGSNENQIMRTLLRSGIMLSCVDDPHSCFYALQSRDEMANVKRILGDNIVKGRMKDIIDVGGLPTLVMEDGTRNHIPGLNLDAVDEIFLVNCTARLFEDKPPTPLLWRNGMVLKPQTVLLHTGWSASMMTHIWFSGKLPEVLDKFYRVCYHSSGKKKGKFFFESAVAGFYNFLVCAETLSDEVMSGDLTNTARWYPWYRQVLIGLKARAMREQVIMKCNQLLGPEMKYSAITDENALL